MRYGAFISYNYRDKAEAMRLHRALERYRFPKRLVGRATPYGLVPQKLKPVFRDRDELAAGADLTAAVQAALAESEALIVICSPAGAQSRWVNEEIRQFRALGRGDRIRCLIIGGEPHAADPAEECLPPALAEQGAAEPLAADLRPGQDGRRPAVLKLIASLVDLPYDELRQREAQRRQRRLAAIATAASIGFVVMAALSVFALLSRQAAVAAQREAIAQRDIARRRTLTAERTVDFVKSMFTASDPSEARGASITAGEILDRGVRQIATGLANELAVRAEMGVTLSQVYGTLGLYRKSDELVRGTFAIRHGDASIAAHQWLALAESQARLGHHDRAVASYRRGIALARATGDEGGQLSRLLVGLGAALSEEGEKGAAAPIREALAIDRAAGPAGVNDVARDLEVLGIALINERRFAEARPHVEQALAIRRRMEGELSPSVSDDLNNLATIAYFTGDLAAAERNMRSRIAIDERVLGRNHPDVGISLNNLARLLIERRNYAGAEPLLKRAIALGLREREPTHDDFAFLFSNLAIAEAGLGRPRDARANFQKALRAAEAHDHVNRAPIMADIAALDCREGRADEGLALLARAEPIMLQDHGDEPWRAAWIVNARGLCLVAKGERAEGIRLLRQSTQQILQRWPASSHYGGEASRRLAQAGAP